MWAEMIVCDLLTKELQHTSDWGYNARYKL